MPYSIITKNINYLILDVVYGFLLSVFSCPCVVKYTYMFRTIVNLWCTVHSIVLSMANQLRIFSMYTSVMQWKPTVDQINKMNWFPVCHKWYSIGESLGISKGLMEEIIHKTGLLFGIYHNNLCDTLCIKAMLIKWLNEDQGTGSSERTWITIAKAVKDVGLGEVVFEFLEEGMCNIIDYDHWSFLTALSHQEQIMQLKPYRLLHFTIMQFSKAMSSS